MEHQPIRTEADYDRALVEVARYFQDVPRPGSVEAARFDALAFAIEAYEAEHWQIEPKRAAQDQGR